MKKVQISNKPFNMDHLVIIGHLTCTTRGNQCELLLPTCRLDDTRLHLYFPSFIRTPCGIPSGHEQLTRVTNSQYNTRSLLHQTTKTTDKRTPLVLWTFPTPSSLTIPTYRLRRWRCFTNEDQHQDRHDNPHLCRPLGRCSMRRMTFPQHVSTWWIPGCWNYHCDVTHCDGWVFDEGELIGSRYRKENLF